MARDSPFSSRCSAPGEMRPPNVESRSSSFIKSAVLNACSAIAPPPDPACASLSGAGLKLLHCSQLLLPPPAPAPEWKEGKDAADPGKAAAAKAGPADGRTAANAVRDGASVRTRQGFQRGGDQQQIGTSHASGMMD